MFTKALIAALLLTMPAAAQDKKAEPEGPPKRVRSILLYGDETCPKSEDPDEIVVCANAGDSPYRIPKQFRNKPSEAAGARSWTSRMETVEEVNRSGLPNSCSPVGSGGQTGCTRAMIRQWYLERLQQKAQATREGAPSAP